LEFGDEIGLGADGSVVAVRDRVGDIEGVEREGVDLLPIGVARNLAGNVLGPGEDLIAKELGGSRLDRNAVDVEAEPEDL
jgi:hypothetical protein